MKPLKLIPIIIVGILYLVKIIPLTIHLFKDITSIGDPKQYLYATFILLIRGMLTEFLILMVGITGIFIRNIYGFIMTLIFPLHIVGYVLFKLEYFSSFNIIYLIFTIVVTTLLSIPSSREYYKLTTKNYLIGITSALVIGSILSFFRI